MTSDCPIYKRPSLFKFNRMHLIIAYDDSTEDYVTSNVFRFCGALRVEAEQLISYQVVRWGSINRLAANVSDGYAFFVNNYRPGDKLFIFGFAGGAFAARVLANFVARFGVLVRGHTSHKSPVIAYKDGKLDDFKVSKVKPTENFASQIGHFPPRVYDVQIEVVGCWDTTASLAASPEFKHFDPSLHKGQVHFPWLSSGSDDGFPGIKHAFHALALDECRSTFTPALWFLPDDPTVANCNVFFQSNLLC